MKKITSCTLHAKPTRVSECDVITTRHWHSRLKEVSSNRWRMNAEKHTPAINIHNISFAAYIAGRKSNKYWFHVFLLSHQQSKIWSYLTVIVQTREKASHLRSWNMHLALAWQIIAVNQQYISQLIDTAAGGKACRRAKTGSAEKKWK